MIYPNNRSIFVEISCKEYIILEGYATWTIFMGVIINFERYLRKITASNTLIINIADTLESLDAEIKIKFELN